MTRLEKYLLKQNELRVFPECPRPFLNPRFLQERRRRARRHQRWAIALCLIGSALLLAWEMFNG